MIVNVAQPGKRSLRGLRGLNDPFDPTQSYTATNNILDMATDLSVQDRVINIVNGGIVGQFNNSPVYNDVATGKVFINVGLSYPRLQEITPAPLTSAPPATGTDCPCNNCHEEEIVETWYASKTKVSASDIPVKMTSEVVICEPTDTNAAPRVLCPDDAARLGINGLGYIVPRFTPAQKKCMDGCSGLPADKWNACMDRCTTINPPSLAGIGAVSKSKYQQGLIFTGLTADPTTARTADGAWGKCTAECNRTSTGQIELQRCYAACGTKGPGVFGQYAVAPTGQLVPLSGLSNDAGAPTTDTSGYVYDPALTYPIPPTMNCEQGNSNTLLLILTGVAGLAIGWLATTAWKKR